MVNSGGSLNIDFRNNSTITNFTNEGIIDNQGNGLAIRIYTTNSANATKVSTFVNKGTIQAKENHGVYADKATIGAFINESNGTIQSQTKGNTVLIRNGSTIENFTNEGIINTDASSYHVVYLADLSTLVKNFTNTGTISSSYATEDHSSYILHVGNGSTIENFTNSGLLSHQGGADISAARSGAFWINGIVNTFTNTGMIDSK